MSASEEAQLWVVSECAVLLFVGCLKDGMKLEEAQKTDKEIKPLALVIQLGFCVTK